MVPLGTAQSGTIYPLANSAFCAENISNREGSLGRLCSFAQCPNKGKRDCSVEGCGNNHFLAEHEDFIFCLESLGPEGSVVLFDRNGEQLSSTSDVRFICR
jgi:hypothetical protein